jgi:hypothetical protein
VLFSAIVFLPDIESEFIGLGGLPNPYTTIVARLKNKKWVSCGSRFPLNIEGAPLH